MKIKYFKKLILFIIAFIIISDFMTFNSCAYYKAVIYYENEEDNTEENKDTKDETEIKVNLDSFSEDITGDFSNYDTATDDFRKKDTASIKAGFNKVLSKYKVLVVGILGLIVMTLVGWLLILFMALGKLSEEPRARKATITGILITLIALALMGSFTLYFSLAFNVFR